MRRIISKLVKTALLYMRVDFVSFIIVVSFTHTHIYELNSRVRFSRSKNTCPSLRHSHTHSRILLCAKLKRRSALYICISLARFGKLFLSRCRYVVTSFLRSLKRIAITYMYAKTFRTKRERESGKILAKSVLHLYTCPYISIYIAPMRLYYGNSNFDRLYVLINYYDYCYYINVNRKPSFYMQVHGSFLVNLKTLLTFSFTLKHATISYKHVYGPFHVN